MACDLVVNDLSGLFVFFIQVDNGVFFNWRAESPQRQENHQSYRVSRADDEQGLKYIFYDRFHNRDLLKSF